MQDERKRKHIFTELFDRVERGQNGMRQFQPHDNVQHQDLCQALKLSNVKVALTVGAFVG